MSHYRGRGPHGFIGPRSHIGPTEGDGVQGGRGGCWDLY